MQFRDRIDAGRQLAEKVAANLEKFSSGDAVVYALPRGGVPVAREVAARMRAPLDLTIARKVGYPGNPEYAVCAVSEDGVLVCNEAERKALDPEWFEHEVLHQTQEAVRRRKHYAGRKHVSARGKRAIIVDDGVATGLTLRAAIASVRNQKPDEIIVAVPVIPADTAGIIRREADQVIACVEDEDYRGSVGAYYDDFPQVSDEEVVSMLAQQRE